MKSGDIEVAEAERCNRELLDALASREPSWRSWLQRQDAFYEELNFPRSDYEQVDYHDTESAAVMAFTIEEMNDKRLGWLELNPMPDETATALLRKSFGRSGEFPRLAALNYKVRRRPLNLLARAQMKVVQARIGMRGISFVQLNDRLTALLQQEKGP